MYSNSLAISSGYVDLIPLHEGKNSTDQTYHIDFMYGEDDLSSCRLFAGGLINFGIWKSKLTKTITIEERIESERNMYRHVLNKLDVTSEDLILEVGCGLGVGDALIVNEFQPKHVKGVDISSAQIARAKKINQELERTGKLSFEVAAAEDLNLEINSFDKVISIEAAQHFSSVNKFIKEAYSVLKPCGKIAIATFFGTSEKSYEGVIDKLETVRDGVDHLTPIEQVRAQLQRSGFRKIKVESIGRNVWHGYDKWIAQLDEFKDTWDANWIKCYRSNLIDYYLVTAEK